MRRIHGTIDIRAPVQRVYEFLNQPSNLPGVWPHMVSVSNIVPREGGASDFDWVFKMGGVHFKGHAFVEQARPGEYVRFRTEGGIPSTFVWTVPVHDWWRAAHGRRRVHDPDAGDRQARRGSRREEQRARPRRAAAEHQGSARARDGERTDHASARDFTVTVIGGEPEREKRSSSARRGGRARSVSESRRFRDRAPRSPL